MIPAHAVPSTGALSRWCPARCVSSGCSGPGPIRRAGLGRGPAPLAGTVVDVTPILYVVGDVHLPAGEPAFARFCEALARRPPARLVILGDLFDYWLDTAHAVHRYRDCLCRLRRLRRAGWRVELILGNREMTAGRRLERAFGGCVHWPAMDLALGPRRLRVVHGDRLCRDPGYHLLFAAIRAFPLRVVRACVPGWCQEGVARLIRRCSRARQDRSRSASGPGAPLRLLHPGRLRAAGRGVDTVIAGHIHQALRRRVAGVDLILAGEWVGTRGAWVEGYADGRLLARYGETVPVQAPGEFGW